MQPAQLSRQCRDNLHIWKHLGKFHHVPDGGKAITLLSNYGITNKILRERSHGESLYSLHHGVIINKNFIFLSYDID
jgi:hypothetical protein